MSFEVPPHIFDRIEFRCIGRQPFDDDSSPGRGDEVFDQNASMNGCSIPENQHFPTNVSFEMSEKVHHLGALDTAGVHLKIEPPERQSSDDRETFPVEGLVEHRRLSARRPSPNPCGAGAQPAFVYKDDGSPLLAGFFFSAGQSTRFHRRIAFSSRSTARRSGRWQLKPLAPINRQT